MWCPDGYLRFLEVIGGDELRDCAELFIQDRGKDWVRALSKVTERFPQLEVIIQDDGDLSFIIREVLSRWAFLKLMQSPQMKVHLCSPQGAVLRCDFPIGFAMPHMKVHYWDNFDPYTADTDTYVDLFKRDLELEFFGINFATGQVKMPTVKFGSRRHKFDISAVLHPERDYWIKEDDDERQAIWKTMMKFEGWAVCFPRNPALESGQSAYNALVSIPSVLDLKRAVSGETRLAKGGRPSLRKSAAAQFRLMYARGLDEVSLTEASRKLGYDRKTLRRALIEDGIIGDTPED